jgi:hypothetical protein
LHSIHIPVTCRLRPSYMYPYQRPIPSRPRSGARRVRVRDRHTVAIYPSSMVMPCSPSCASTDNCQTVEAREIRRCCKDEMKMEFKECGCSQLKYNCALGRDVNRVKFRRWNFSISFMEICSASSSDDLSSGTLCFTDSGILFRFLS